MEGNSVKPLNNDVVAGRGASRRQRALRRGSVLAAAIVAAVLGLAACGGGSGASSNAGGSTNAQRLAFSRCVRSHGVPNYPDPDSGGHPPASAKQIALNNPQFPAASRECQHLLPNGGNGMTEADVQQMVNAMEHFTHCMRSHGVANWPDPVLDRNPNRGPNGRPFFDIQGISTDSPQISTNIQECEHLLPTGWAPGNLICGTGPGDGVCEPGTP